MKRIAIHLSMLFVLVFFSFKGNAQTQPPLFVNTLVSNGWDGVEGFAQDISGQQYVWEKTGLVWVIDTAGSKLAQPLIDIREEVGNWRDHGLNGFALDPNFRTNGYFYLYYTVDRHHLLYFGTPTYHADSNLYFDATIARVTRYTANPVTNFTTIIPNSRFVLVGENKKMGIPVLYDTHSAGSLIFGRDGSLLVSTGDGASPATADSGRIAAILSYWQQALVDSIIKPNENVGAYRSQMLNSLSGKILRINPLTGNGYPSNPFYDSSDARSAKSRVWALGLRNPFRMTLKPNTGIEDPTGAQPGTLMIGDVGWQFWEEVNVCNVPGQNFGWPVYQGYDLDPNYFAAKQYNFDAPNPLFGSGGCNKPYFTFHELIQNPTANGLVSFPNPCNVAVQIPSTVKKFVHARPVIDYFHGNQSRTGIFSGNTASVIDIDNAGSPVNGVRFGGFCSIGGCWITGTTWPLQYQNSYYHGDFAAAWVKQFKFNASDSVTNVNNFAGSLNSVVFMAEKDDGCLYYVNYPTEIRKICYTGYVNNPPTAVAIANKKYGASPLTINFAGYQSFDPTNDPLTFNWKFGDGTTSTSINPSHTYIVSPGVVQSYWAVLAVTDTANNVSKDSILISVNNTPPVVNITSFNDGDFYSMLGQTSLPLQAIVTDAEHGPSQLYYKWEVFLHHNNHNHPESGDTNKISTAIITPLGCNGETYYYRIRLTVTDAGGLSSYQEKKIYPNCCQAGNFSAAITPAGTTSYCAGSTVTLSATTGTGFTYKWYRNNTLLASTASSINAGTAGTYKCIVTGGLCSATTNSVVLSEVNNPAPSITYTTPLTFCSPGSVTLMANTFAGVTYQWQKNSINIAGATGQSYVANAAGGYRVIETANGCSKSFQVSVLAATTVNAVISTNDPTTLCNAGTVNMTLNNPIPGYSYQWQNNGNAISGATGITYAATSTGNYTCRVTASCGTATSNTIAVSIGSFNAQLFPSGNLVLCTGGSLLLSASTGTGFGYQWKNNGVNISGATGSTYTATASGSYTVFITSPCGSGTSPAAVITLNTVTASLTPVGTVSICSGATQLLTANAGSGYTYRWYRNNVLQSATAQTFNAGTAGSYKVEVSIGGSCAVQSNTMVLDVINNPTPAITPLGPTTFCNGQSVSLSANTFAGVSYQWLRNSVSITGATSQNYTATTAGAYKVIETANGCNKTAPQVSVTVNCREAGELIAESIVMHAIQIYPNPFNEKIIIEFIAPHSASATIKVVDLLGAMKWQEIISTTSSYEWQNNLPSGIYFIQITMDTDVETFRVVKTN
jgi:glucose/arabinose dehydrogenase